MSDNKSVLVLLHGMGNHTSESFKDEVVSAANNALHRYSGYKEVKFEDHVHIESIEYNNFFEEARQSMVKNSDPVAQYLKLKGQTGVVHDVANAISGLGQGFKDDSFINTHWLDVILYLTNVGEQVRVHVGKKLAGIIEKYPVAPINVLAHSLGTSVLHDTLTKLYHHEFDPGDLVPDLDIHDHKLNSVWMISNVSRIMSKFSGQKDPYKSIVKPGSSGCTSLFFNCRHEMDPFTWPLQFDPKKQSKWINVNTYDSIYKAYVTRSISRVNTHDIRGYIEDPRICYRFLNQFLDFSPSNEDWETGNSAFETINGIYDKIKKKYEKIEGINDPSLLEFLKLIYQFEPFIKELEDGLQG